MSLGDVPFITKAWVRGYDAEQRLLYVIGAGGQSVPPVRMLFAGPADGAAVNQVEMPRIGTAGLVIFPNQDSRDGFWLGSIYDSPTNAITSDSGSPFENYFAHWCGAFRYLDEKGDFTYWSPDGSYFKLGETTSVPTVYRHEYQVDGTSSIERNEYPVSERVAKTASPKYLHIHHASGTSATIDPSGNATLDITTGKTFTINCNGASIEIDASGNVKINSASGAQTQFNDITDSLALVSKTVQWLSEHEHIDSVGGTTSPPVTPIDSTTIESERVTVDK